MLGRKGRGHRPLVLCTELLRSTREREDPKLRKRLDKLVAKIDRETNAAKKAALMEEREDILDEVFKRNVGVYGAINLRTDGNSAIVAFRNEKGSDTKRWFHYALERDRNGVFQVAEGDAH